MNTFESSLLTELREHVAHQAAAPARRTRAKRLKWSVVPAGGVAAAAVAFVLVQSPAAAYAVEKADNGDVVVTIDKLSDAAGLQSALRADGIHAVVNYDADFVPVAPPGISGGSAGGSDPEFGTESGPKITSDKRPEPSLTRSGTVVTGSAPKGCGSTEPVNVAMSADSVTFRIGADQIDKSATLYITTGGSQGSGLSAVQIRWEC